MRYLVRVRGRGRVEVAAYGLGDAEHLAEKEICRLWPEATVEVLEVSHAPGATRIVEEFFLAYRVDATVEVEADSESDARRTAFRAARERLAESRYRHTSWEAAGAQAAGPPGPHPAA